MLSVGELDSQRRSGDFLVYRWGFREQKMAGCAQIQNRPLFMIFICHGDFLEERRGSIAVSTVGIRLGLEVGGVQTSREVFVDIDVFFITNIISTSCP